MSIDDYDLKLPNGNILWFKTAEEAVAAAKVRDVWNTSKAPATEQPFNSTIKAEEWANANLPGKQHVRLSDEQPDDCKKSFEKWASNLGWRLKTNGVPYMAYETRCGWDAWQAAWNQRPSEREAQQSVYCSTKSALLPCPFCGGDAVIDNSCRHHTVYCTKCGALPDDDNGANFDRTRAQAIKYWNRRAPKREVQQPDDCGITLDLRNRIERLLFRICGENVPLFSSNRLNNIHKEAGELILVLRSQPMREAQHLIQYPEPMKDDVLYIDMGNLGWRQFQGSAVVGYSREYGQLETIGGAIYNPGEWMIILRNGKPFSFPMREAVTQVRFPQNVEEAQGMALLGVNYLEEHAPHLLKVRGNLPVAGQTDHNRRRG